MKKLISVLILSVCLFSCLFVSVSAEGSKPDKAVKAVNAGADYVDIKIDGKFDDWEDKPHTQIFNPYESNGRMIHSGCLLRDDKTLYLHIKMSDTKEKRFMGWDYRFVIDGKEKNIQVSDSKVDRSKKNSSWELPVVNRDGGQAVAGSKAILTLKDNQPEEFEMSIPLEYFNNNPQTISTITFSSLNLGKQSLQAVNSPTLPLVLAGIGFAMAGCGYLKVKKNNKKNGK